MIKTKNMNNYLLKVLIGAIMVVVIVFIFSATIFLITSNSKRINSKLHDVSSEPNNSLNIYVVSGKIIDIQDKTIFLETPIFDLVNKRWDKDKKETRKLTITSNTEFFKQYSKRDKKENEVEPVLLDKIKFEDIKTGYDIQANYSESVVGVKDFSPTIITILPNQ